MKRETTPQRDRVLELDFNFAGVILSQVEEKAVRRVISREFLEARILSISKKFKP